MIHVNLLKPKYRFHGRTLIGMWKRSDVGISIVPAINKEKTEVNEYLLVYARGANLKDIN